MNTNNIKTRVWDLPTRLFHWILAFCVAGSFISVKLGGLWMDWHVRLGLAVTGLIVFRLIWGLVGPRYARFAQFVRSPLAVLRYLRSQTMHIAGHNPLGAYSVLALILSIGFQAFSGLFTNDDVMTAGPLASVSETWSATLGGLHKLNEWILLALITLHIVAILWYRLKKRKNLLGAMLHGDVSLELSPGQSVPSAKDTWAVRLGALILALAIAAGLWWLTTLVPAADAYY
ncbi:cytochrome b/b6 domain-containing protein [Alcaligenaceae bacterium]|nr:cytochrome b/b6 domain-containing protein [Alcaligenaceae bacterium]